MTLAVMQQTHIQTAAAHAAVACGVAYAQTIAQKVNIAVVDASGILLSFVRMQGAALHSIDIAIDKAYTSASFGLATLDWAKVLPAHSPALQQGLILRPRFVAFGGGVPIMQQAVCVGAIGVSGASEEQDHAIAHAVLQAVL